jgi:hypothetical protein
MKIRNVLPDRYNLADKFVANHHRHRNRGLRPIVPFINVQIGAANSSEQNPDLNIIYPRLRLRNIIEPEAAAGFGFNQSFHG